MLQMKTFIYTQYLHQVESGQTENIDAPQIAIDYYGLDHDAKLTDVIKKVRADEENHSKVNLGYSE